MKKIVLAACLCAFVPVAAMAASKRVERSLEVLDPMTRLEQVCAIETMARMKKDKGPHRPDRAVVNAVSDPVLNGNTVTGDGGAFRSKGKWYRYSFTCQATADHKSVSAFSYTVGNPIPEEQWENYGLY